MRDQKPSNGCISCHTIAQIVESPWLNPLAITKKTFKNIARKRRKSVMRTLKSPSHHRSGDKDNHSITAYSKQAAEAAAVMVAMRREPMETDVLGGGGDDTQALDSKEAKTDIANPRPMVNAV